MAWASHKPIGAIIRVIAAKRNDSEYAIGLKKYLLAVVAYFLVLAFMVSFERTLGFGSIIPIYTLILPWAYAVWYILHIRKWKKKRKNIEAYDRMKMIEAPDEERLLLNSYPKKKVQLKPSIPALRLKNLNMRRAIIRPLPNLNTTI